MTNITAKEVRTAASSVAGARGTGIETDASRAAPELLTRAEAALVAATRARHGFTQVQCSLIVACTPVRGPSQARLSGIPQNLHSLHGV